MQSYEVSQFLNLSSASDLVATCFPYQLVFLFLPHILVLLYGVFSVIIICFSFTECRNDIVSNPRLVYVPAISCPSYFHQGHSFVLSIRGYRDDHVSVAERLLMPVNHSRQDSALLLLDQPSNRRISCFSLINEAEFTVTPRHDGFCRGLFHRTSSSATS